MPSEQQKEEEVEYKEWLRKKLEEKPKGAKGKVDESVTLKRCTARPRPRPRPLACTLLPRSLAELSC